MPQNRQRDRGDSKLRARIDHLQKCLDLAEEEIRLLRRVADKVAKDLTAYPNQLPQHVCDFTDGQYTYLLDCLRTKLEYHAHQLVNRSESGPDYAARKTPPHRILPEPPSKSVSSIPAALPSDSLFPSRYGVKSKF